MSEPDIRLPRDLRALHPDLPREIWAKKHGQPFMRILTNAERVRLHFDSLYISRVLRGRGLLPKP